MLNKNFIFSEKRSDRIKRHLLFWLFWYVYIGITHAANPFGSPEISYFKNPVFTFTECFFIVLAQVPVTYAILYVVLPQFILKKKYLLAFLAIVLLWFLCGILNLYFFRDVLPKTLSMLLPHQYLANTQRPESASFFMAVTATNKGAFTIASMALMIKFVKYWYLKEQRNLQLQKENTEAQLQLLTAQVHPHFLFNTLNNIYSQTQTESPKGSKMIMELSDMLRYILAEGSKTLVPLQKELAMMQDYINLEKVRYGNSLDLHLSIPKDACNLQIAPLILLPFVENCFKHGASKFLSAPWINLKIEINGKQLLMKLMNGKYSDQQEEHPKSGIGISNVKKRLELLYKDKHELQIIDEPEVFVVNLSLELTEGKTESTTIKEPTTILDYA